ncbi:MAG: MiaB/RimO family radical SAM methylthiotransferase [Tepidiformaceae bacterium]
MAGRPLAAILTLGCKLNLADSEEIARGLRAAGYGVVDRLCDADAYVVNTCSVTHVADRKARRLIRSVRRMAPEAALAVAGCYPGSAGEGVIRELGADFVAGTRDADKAALVAFLAGRPGDVGRVAPPERAAFHVRAFIKAQEGCNDVCAFCIVPRTRGREESRTPDVVVADVRAAVDRGVREVVITGTQLGAWGRDFETPQRPPELIAAILEGVEVPRLRFSSLQPQDITPEVLGLWQDPRLMPHFHLALQAGSDATLTRMRRRYTKHEFRDAAARIRAAVPGAAITTDVIAGFPGESDADFDETLAFCEEVGFARLHCFPYSVRAKTGAAQMAGKRPSAVVRERMARLLALGEALAERHRASMEGSVRPVLWENAHPGAGGMVTSGLTDNYLRVYTRGEGLLNRVTPVIVGPSYDDGAWGTLYGGEP